MLHPGYELPRRGLFGVVRPPSYLNDLPAHPVVQSPYLASVSIGKRESTNLRWASPCYCPLRDYASVVAMMKLFDGKLVHIS